MTEVMGWFADHPSTWGGVLLLALLLGLGFLEVRQTRQPKSGAQHNQNPTRQPQSLVRQKHSTEEEHRTAEQAYWDRHIESQNRRDWIGWITLSFSGIAAVGVVLGFEQTRRQADIAQDTLTATTRAWFDVDVDMDAASNSLNWKDGVGATLRAKVGGINNGNSPVIDANVFSRLVVDDNDFMSFPRQLIKDACTTWRPIDGGDLVFMKERIESLGPAIIGWQTPSVRLPPDDIATSPATVRFYFIACAIYRVTGDNKWHYTARIFRVLRLDDLDATRSSYQLKVGEDLDGERLALVKEDTGAYAD